MVLNYILVGCPENIAKRKQFITSIDALPCACVGAWRRKRSKPQSVYRYFETKVVGKSARDNPNHYCGCSIVTRGGLRI